MKTTLSLSLAIVTLGLVGGTANAADLHIDGLATKLQRQTARLTHELDHQFRYTREYKHLLKDAEEMEYLAKHIHDVAHDFGSRRHIATDVRKLDRLYHHTEELVDRMEYRARRRARDHHYGYHYEVRGIRVAQIRQLQRVMSLITETLHHLKADLKPARHGRLQRRFRPAFIAPPRPLINVRF